MNLQRLLDIDAAVTLVTHATPSRDDAALSPDVADEDGGTGGTDQVNLAGQGGEGSQGGGGAGGNAAAAMAPTLDVRMPSGELLFTVSPQLPSGRLSLEGGDASEGQGLQPVGFLEHAYLEGDATGACVWCKCWRPLGSRTVCITYYTYQEGEASFRRPGVVPRRVPRTCKHCMYQEARCINSERVTFVMLRFTHVTFRDVVDDNFCNVWMMFRGLQLYCVDKQAPLLTADKAKFVSSGFHWFSPKFRSSSTLEKVSVPIT